MNKEIISQQTYTELLATLKIRFENNMVRHTGIRWNEVQEKLEVNPQKLWSLLQMEQTGGEPDVVSIQVHTFDLEVAERRIVEFIFCDCSPESPQGRRSLCYDQNALDSRKEHKPKDSALAMAGCMGIELLTEQQYRQLQQLGQFDLKTSSWVQTPATIRKLGGALFADRRYDTVFIYHNGAESYYAARGFRGLLQI